MEDKSDPPKDDPEAQEKILEEELATLNDFLSDLKQRREWKSELRKLNINVENRPEESDFHKLDSSLKKNTAFVRKIRNFTEAQKDAILKELNSLNLTKYIGEVASAIVEAKLKMNDLPGMVEIASKLHQRYAEFSPSLLSAWQKILTIKKDEKSLNASKLRVDLRFYSDLISVGVFTLKDSLSLLGNVLIVLVAMDKEDHAHISIILTFCKHCGDEYAGLVPRKIRLLAEKHGKEIPAATLLPPDKQKNVKQMLRDYFATVCKHLISEQKELMVVERTNRRIMMTKGEVHVERRERAELLQNTFSKLFTNAEMLADILDEDMPELSKEDPKKKEEDFEGNEEEQDVTVDTNNGTSSLWEDEDMKNFYENIVDLKPIVPAILYKDILQAKKSSEPPEDPKPAEDLKVEDETFEDEEEMDEPINENEEVAPPDIEDDVEDADTQNTSTKMLLDAFLSNLPMCVNREMIDSAAAEFCLSLNTKINRKKLVKGLFNVHRNRQDLLPFYARFVATLNPLIPDIATDLGQYLKQEFRWQVRKKDQMKIESKLKVCRFIGELVKFNMFPKSECLFCIKQLLFDFSHHHIDMACTFMEVCGRFLYYSPDSHRRTKIYLEQMMRKKVAISMDSRYIMLIENAYYSVNPPDMQQESKPKKSPLEQYVSKLLYTDLGRTNTEKILKQIRKLNWDEPNEVAFVVRLLGEVWNYKYYNIRYAASLLAGLVFYQEWVGPQILDNILEDIRLMMEVNHPKYNQRRISVVKFLAELYNYRMVDSTVIFGVLYSLITYETGGPEDFSILDPPDHLLRIRLVCTILETCGVYFVSGTNKKKLDYFLIFFQQYYWKKRSSPYWHDIDNPFPFVISSHMEETLPAVRPKMTMFTSPKEANEAVEKINKEMHAKIREKAPQFSELFGKMSLSSESPTPGVGGLHTIDEDMDEEEEGEEDEDRHSTSRSRSASQLDNPEEDDEEEDIDDSQTEDASQEDEDFEETNSIPGTEDFHIPSAPKFIKCDEDDDFISMFDKMLNENIAESRAITARPGGGGQLPPAQGRLQKKTYEQLIAPEQVDTVQFSILLRKGTKHAYKEIKVSADSEIARNLQKQEEADRLEKERVKKLTLEMNERQEEEDLHEAIASMQRPLNTMNRNVDRRFRQPMKGTPDADAIFGSKKSGRQTDWSQESEIENLSPVVAVRGKIPILKSQKPSPLEKRHSTFKRRLDRFNKLALASVLEDS